MSWNASLRYGEAGEAIWYQAHPGLERTDGLTGDFKDADGNKWELKTDLWNMDSTPNFFMERYSNKEQCSPGGPWQALAHGCRYFVYFYVANLTYFKWEAAELVAHLDIVVPTLKPTEVANKNYVTLGYRVPRDMLTDIAERVELKVSK